MEPELKAKWVEELRSGGYDQGTGALCDAGYCCLGVLFCGVLHGPSLNHNGDPAGLPTPLEMLRVGLNENHAEQLAAINDRELIDWDEIPEPVKAALEYEEEGGYGESGKGVGRYYKSDFAHIAAAIEAWEDL